MIGPDQEQRAHRALQQAAAADIELKVVGEGFSALKKSYFDAWMASSPAEGPAREKLWVACTIVSQVEAHLRKIVANAPIAHRELEEIKRAGEPKKRFGGII